MSHGSGYLHRFQGSVAFGRGGSQGQRVPKGKKMPKCRLGHGLDGINPDTKEGKDLIKIMKKNGVVLEFQLTSNVRLNNLTDLKMHPIKKYLERKVAKQRNIRTLWLLVLFYKERQRFAVQV